MAIEEATIPVTPRRTTRSSSSSITPSKPPRPSNPLPAPDLLFAGEPRITSDALLSSLPGRRAQILDLLRLIGPPGTPMLPLLLYGGAATGKTTAILQVFRHLRRPLVYVGCRSCYSPRTLFDSVLDQLTLHRRSPGNGYSSAKRCERAADFVNLLRDALLQLVRARGEMVYLVFDNVELIRSWEKNSGILSLLFRISDILKIPELGLIYISGASMDAYYSMTGSVEPVPVYFPDYTADELHSIFMRNQTNPKLYSSFLSIVLKPFVRVTRRVDELAIAFEPLFRKFCEPLSDLGVAPDEATKRRLFNYLQPHLAASLNEVFKVPSRSSAESNKEGSCGKRENIRRLSSKEAFNELDFHMSMSAKYLVLSAFLASRNPATLDASLFDSTGGSNNRKRKRKSSQATIDHQDDIAEEKLMQGPGSFPLDRLLAIFQCITSVAEDVLEEEQLQDGMATVGGNMGLMSDVLLQLSTLCNANFIVKSASCPLEGSTRYRSTIDEDMASKVARSVNFPLSKYMYRR